MELHQLQDTLIEMEEEGAECTQDLLFISQRCICYLGC